MRVFFTAESGLFSPQPISAVATDSVRQFRETAFASLTRSRTLLAVRDCEAAAGLLDTTVELCRQAFGPLAVQTRVARLAQTRASSLLGRHAQATAWKEKLAALTAEPK